MHDGKARGGGFDRGSHLIRARRRRQQRQATAEGTHAGEEILLVRKQHRRRARLVGCPSQRVGHNDVRCTTELRITHAKLIERRGTREDFETPALLQQCMQRLIQSHRGGRDGDANHVCVISIGLADVRR